MKVRELYLKLRDKLMGDYKLSEKNLQLILIIVAILLVNIVSITLNFRLDLTRSRMYSLSEKSREVVGNLNEKLTVRVLFSKDLPAQHNAVFRYLVDLLDEYNYYGNRNFRYEIVNEKDLEKSAAEYGIAPVMSKELENDQVKLRRTYMGLVIQQADVIEKINAITSTSGVEYTITSLMQKVSSRVDGLLKLERPIEVRLYLDSNLKYLPIKDISGLAEKAEKTVQKCNVRNYDKLAFKLVDPTVEKTSTAAASMYGLNLLRWKGGTGSFGKVIPAGDYLLGMVVQSGNKYEAIEIGVAPTIFGENVLVGVNNLEDRINNAVGNLVSNNPTVGYIVGHGEVEIRDQQTKDGGGLLKHFLSDMYELKEIDLSKGDIPSDMQVIVVNGATSEFSAGELYKIDQYLMKGKKAVFFMKSFTEAQMPGQMAMSGGQQSVLPTRTGLDELLKHYGVTVNRDYVLDKSCAKIQMESFIAPYPVVPIIKEAGLDKESIVTEYLKGLAFDRVSSIDLDKKRIAELGLVARELVKSSNESWVMKGNINLHPLLMNAAPGADVESRTLAVLLTGRLQSYFKGKEMPASDTKDGNNAAKGSSLTTVARLDETIPTGKTELIVLGSSEITASGFLIDSGKILSSGMQREDEDFPNGLFLHNIIDYLAGNYYVPEMRNKRLEYNPLERVTDGMKYLYKILNIAGLPALVVLFGFITWRRVHMRKKLIQREFSREV